MLKLLKIVLICLVFSFPAYAGIKVVDGDSLKINGAKVRLYGLDAPEHDQTCEADGSEYSCGQDAKIALQGLITDETFCVIKGGDRYKRVLAVCYNGNKDINAELVRKGFAVAYVRYAKDYVKQESKARQNKAGIWQGEFINPEDYRKRKKNGK